MDRESSIAGAIATLPRFAYELIAYFGSSLLFFALLLHLLVGAPRLYELLEAATGVDAALGVLFGLALAQVWGQMASTFSYYIVKRSVNRVVRAARPRSMADYFFDYPNALGPFTILPSDKTTGNYWTIMYYIHCRKPNIAEDLLVRYARTKLSRINAFNFLVLSAVSVGSWMIRDRPVSHVGTGLGIGFPYSSLVLAGAAILFFLEFYQRQCWFGDIVLKAYAAVFQAEEIGGVTPSPPPKARR